MSFSNRHFGVRRGHKSRSTCISNAAEQIAGEDVEHNGGETQPMPRREIPCLKMEGNQEEEEPSESEERPGGWTAAV